MNWARKIAGPLIMSVSSVSVGGVGGAAAQAVIPAFLPVVLAAFSLANFWLFSTLTHWWLLAEASEASSTSWLATPSAKSGRNAALVLSAVRKSASVFVKVCS